MVLKKENQDEKKFHDRFSETPGGVKITKWVPDKPGKRLPEFED